MPPEFSLREPYFRIALAGSDKGFPTLLDISNFLYDFNLLYEITRLATDPRYNDFRFSQYVFYRNGRPLELGDRLHVEKLSQGSPMMVVAVLTITGGAVGAVWGIVLVLEKIINAPLNRRKLKAEVEKLERENQDASSRHIGENLENPEEVRRVLRIREAESYYENVGGRLQRSSVKVKEVEIEVIEPRKLRNSQ